MPFTELQASIERHFAAGSAAISDPDAMTAFLSLRAALESGQLRSASPDAGSPTGWRVNAWVKQGILLGFRIGVLEDFPTPSSSSSALSFVDKHTFPARHFTASDGVRLVIGGSAIRAGAYVARGVVCAPPMYINAGSFVDEGTIVRKAAVLAAGTILTRGTPVFDLVNGTILRASNDLPLIIPENAVVVPGSRAVSKGKGHPNSEQWGLSLYTPVIVKYRDEKTDLSTTLEDLLR